MEGQVSRPVSGDAQASSTRICDVVIVGGGLAGLSSAEFLLQRDPSMSVLCLEASDKVGGRVQGLEVGVANDDPIIKDVGGEWIIPERHTSVVQLVDRLGLRIFTTSDASPDAKPLKRFTQIGKRAIVRSSGTVSTLKMSLASWETTHVLWKLDGMMEFVSTSDPFWSTPGAALLDATTVRSFLERTCYLQYTKDLIAIKLRFLTGHDPDSVSLLFLLFYAKSNAPSFTHFFNDTRPGSTSGKRVGRETEPQVVARISSGAHDLCARLAKALPSNVLHLNQPVSSVVQTEDASVCVTAMNGQSFKCKRVIVAVPPSIAHSSIEFHPPLPAFKRQAMKSTLMGSYIKFVVTYDEAYWLNTGYAADLLSNGGLQTKPLMEGSQPVTVLTDGTASDNVPTLVGYLGGRQAVQWSSQGTESLKSSILECFASLFGGTWAREPCDIIIKDWNDDVFSGGGSVGAPVPGTMHAFHALKESFGAIFFAGTETAVDNYGTMCGAVESGHRAAVQVLEELKPQSLSSRDMTMIRPNSAAVPALVALVPHEPAMYHNVFRWTIVLPCMALGATFLAVQFRNRYSQLFRPHF